jgi:hypothetical protein
LMTNFSMGCPRALAQPAAALSTRLRGQGRE